MLENKKKYSLIIRNFVFGVEDSLVSTVGLLAGIGFAGVDVKTVILTGAVLIFVEAFSMAIGSLLSEQSVEQYEDNRVSSWSRPVIAATVMFFSYVISGFIPLIPYILQTTNAVWWSIGLTLVSLFVLGIFNAHLFRIKAFKDGLITLFMGGLAIAVGIIVGQIAESLKL